MINNITDNITTGVLGEYVWRCYKTLTAFSSNLVEP